ncbi:zf-TFIIB domain-containing protein [Candidatus Riflebacteria bacterium]
MTEVIFCPKCDNVELETHVIPGDIEIDFCPTCSGYWFDEGELAQKLEFSKDFPDFKKALGNAKETAYSSPRDPNVKLLEMPFLPGEDLLIDYCPSTKGLWFDGGEVEELLKIAQKGDNKKINLLKAMYALKSKLGKGKKYRCPDCTTLNMYSMTTSEGVTVDMCQDCKGVWFDYGEAGRTVELSQDIPDFDEVLKQKKQSDKTCPKCATVKLVEFPYSPKYPDFLVDYCESCRGLWLDANELARLEEVAVHLEDAGTRLRGAKKQLADEGWVSL